MSFREPPRVGYVLKTYPRYSETFVVSEILAHEAAGLPVEIFALRPPSDSYFQDIISRVRSPVTYLPVEARRPSDFWETLVEGGQELPRLWTVLKSSDQEESRDVFQAVLLALEVRRRGISHLHAHFASVATTVTRLASAMAEIPYSCTAHAKDIFHESVDIDGLRRNLASAKAVVTVSDFNVDHLRRSHGPAAATVRRIYNGLDLQQFPFDASHRSSPRILAVGRLVEKKGFSDLVAACALLRERKRDFSCEIIGTGPLEDAIRAQIEDLGLCKHVALLGPQPQSEVIARIRAAAVFAAPCVDGSDGNRDGLPTVLLEAMALGTPCVSTDVTGIPEVVRDSATGRLVRQRDAVALASAIEEMLNRPELSACLARQARSLIESDFDIHRNATEIRRLFGEVCWSDAEAA